VLGVKPKSDAAITGPDHARRRIAYVMSRFPKLTETFVLYELLALARCGHSVEVYPLLRVREGPVHPEAERVAAEATYLPFLSVAIVRSQLRYLRHSPRTYLATLGAVLRHTWGNRNFFLGGIAIFPKAVHIAALLEDRVDHVHCHFANHPATTGYVVHRLTGIPFSFTAHGSDLHVSQHMLCEKVRAAAFVVAISDYNRRFIVETCGEDVACKVEVVRCGVDTSAFRPREARAASGSLRILCVASLEEVKGHAHLLEACRILLADGAPVTCTFVGSGPCEPRLRRQVAACGLEEAIRFAGPRTRPQVVDLLRDADVAVVPSVETARGDREGIPVALTEAMSAGLPVVASDLSGIPELVEHGRTGLLVPPGDPSALAAALRRLGDDSALRERLGREGRRVVLERYDLVRSTRQLARRIGAVRDAS
jgi:colanic acid/amylovoran biosynthesis glycosyltransferase